MRSPEGKKMPQSAKQHPYVEIEGSVLWRKVETMIAALVRNGDLKELTAREYIVGAICQAIAGGETSN
jgi:hypothetical protein